MKIGFLAPISGITEYSTVYNKIVTFLTRKGHDVIHPLSFTPSMAYTWTKEERHASLAGYYAKIQKTDVIIAECSYPCLRLGYEIANSTQKGKEVIILKTKDTNPSTKLFDSLAMEKNIYLYEYQAYNLNDIIAEAIAFSHNQKYKKYNLLFTPEMIAKLNEIAKKKNVPKSVYIRQLLEKGLAMDE